MDVQKKLDEIVAAVGGARSMPMSASCVINRAELLAQLEEVRQALPGSLAQAQELIGGREQMVEEARREAERIIESAHAQRGSLISDTEVARRSQNEADRILADARREAEEIRAEADDYVDSKLANFEVVLSKTIGSVDRGREKLLGRGPGLDEQGYGDPDDIEAPERSQDPQTQRQQADAYVDTKLATFEAVLSATLEAVGRGRQKLLGRVPTDDLGAHMAAQDAAGVNQSRQSSDADFLAGLAEPEAPVAPAAPVIPAQVQSEPVYDTYAYQQPQQQDAYSYQDPYGYQQQAVQQPDPYAMPYEQQPDPYAAYQQQPVAHHPQGQQQPALDETSFFDTSMINLDQLRQYEQGR
ncbi:MULTISPECIES: DivIVA domain-containing protein [unclassified Streptomyces]|uniref:DivIVA domain-containing protein n=1 Tax=unclassified Streptomyces TaxID=2593676 RepID=UPI001BEC24DC|nr:MULTISPECIES: ATP synthase F0 subunit B [unclassified Streptomyces]MBT2405802.1 cell division initiation protein [Streptomyces sp. ISL-21]MBT2453498.1 cell division initiation protein [Streptomyces sp. ISL-86]MBT2608258.1 cell division initiation protein [Streptomyces sp. ISL-87]